METSPNLCSQTPRTELKKFLDEVPSGKIEEFTRQLKKETGATDVIFRNWNRGITPIPVPARKIMNMVSMKCFEKEIFSFETNELH